MSIAVVQTKVISCNSANKSYQLQQLSIAVVQTKVISCNSANKSCLLQVVHTKAIAALTQFCDFYLQFCIDNQPYISSFISETHYKTSVCLSVSKGIMGAVTFRAVVFSCSMFTSSAATYIIFVTNACRVDAWEVVTGI